MKTINTKNENETLGFAEKFARNLKGGEIICLQGDLGVGKTVFTQGLALGLNYKKNVNSPTFVIMKIYKIRNPKSEIRNLIHIDTYRLNSEKDIETIGAQEYFGRHDCITIIEWPERIKKIIPKNSIWINIEIKNKDERTIKISVPQLFPHEVK
ncbi:tRNA (adenosine(37)-N6)-threonylcarbamoyltransferase complex ATPase subunit type 1 TsaE [Candidatus Parcubacteria bacterium]|nr:tRNA (adenosine(37)-N6)-threonylcarbamoyltransferase complex ATPase subunit type 1 TsaE [Candidatus Parcubacteria bacterium]